MVTITDAEIDRISSFAQLEFTPEEKNQMAQQLSEIMTFALQLNKVNTEDVPPTVSVLNLINVWRDDKVFEGLSLEQALAQAKNVQDGCFKVTRIMEEE